jgi:hypothetical protein
MKKNETNITKPSLSTVWSLKKNSLFTPMSYALTCEAHTTESCLRMLTGEGIATLKKSAQVL